MRLLRSWRLLVLCLGTLAVALVTLAHEFESEQNERTLHELVGELGDMEFTSKKLFTDLVKEVKAATQSAKLRVGDSVERTASVPSAPHC